VDVLLTLAPVVILASTKVSNTTQAIFLITKTMSVNHVAALNLAKLLVTTSGINAWKNHLVLTEKLLSKKSLLMAVATFTNAHLTQLVLNWFQTSKLGAPFTPCQFVVKVRNLFELKKDHASTKTPLVVASNTSVFVTKLYASITHQYAHQDKLIKSLDELANVALPTLLSASNSHASRNALKPLLATTLVL
jgi:hypothetical protein